MVGAAFSSIRFLRFGRPCHIETILTRLHAELLPLLTVTATMSTFDDFRGMTEEEQQQFAQKEPRLHRDYVNDFTFRLGQSEGADVKAKLQEIIDAPPTAYSNPQKGQQQQSVSYNASLFLCARSLTLSLSLCCRPIHQMAAINKREAKQSSAASAITHDDQGEHTYTEAIDEVTAQLHRLLQPPIFVGATPATPFRIATLVNNELAEHSHVWRSIADDALPVLEKWFAEHPSDVFTTQWRRVALLATALLGSYDPYTADDEVATLLRHVARKYDMDEHEPHCSSEHDHSHIGRITAEDVARIATLTGANPALQIVVDARVANDAFSALAAATLKQIHQNRADKHAHASAVSLPPVAEESSVAGSSLAPSLIEAVVGAHIDESPALSPGLASRQQQAQLDTYAAARDLEMEQAEARAAAAEAKVAAAMKEAEARAASAEARLRDIEAADQARAAAEAAQHSRIHSAALAEQHRILQEAARQEAELTAQRLQYQQRNQEQQQLVAQQQQQAALQQEQQMAFEMRNVGAPSHAHIEQQRRLQAQQAHARALDARLGSAEEEHKQHGQLLGAHGLRPGQVHWQGPGTSPAAGVNLPYGIARDFVATRLQNTVIAPLQQQVDGLRAERDRLCGVLHPEDPAAVALVREAQARFSKPGGIKLFDRRRLKMVDLRKQLVSKEQMLATLIEEIGELRINCALYRAQVDKDNVARGEVKDERHDRTGRWEEEAARRQRAKEEKLARDAAKVNAVKQPVQLSSYMSEFLPEHMRAPIPGPSYNPQNYRVPVSGPASISGSNYAAVGVLSQLGDDEAMEDNDDDV